MGRQHLSPEKQSAIYFSGLPPKSSRHGLSQRIQGPFEVSSSIQAFKECDDRSLWPCLPQALATLSFFKKINERGKKTALVYVTASFSVSLALTWKQLCPPPPSPPLLSGLNGPPWLFWTNWNLTLLGLFETRSGSSDNLESIVHFHIIDTLEAEREEKVGKKKKL